MFKAVIFDMDGVIFDTERLWKEAFYLANKKFNADIKEEERQSWCGRPTKEVIPLIQKNHPELDAPAYRMYMREYVHSPTHNPKALMKDGFLQCIDFLQSNGIKTALATSATNERVQQLFNGCGIKLNDIFDAVVTADQVKYSKPDPFIYTLTCQKLDIEPQYCAVIEDSPIGLSSAHNAGCHTIMVVDLLPPNDEAKKLSNTIKYSLLDALEYIKQNI